MKRKDKSGHGDKKKKHKDRMVRVGGDNSRRGARHMRCDDIPTDTFTPRTYQVELLESALQGNTIACLGSDSSKLFLGLMVLKQLAHQVRPPLHLGGKRSVYLVNSESDVEQVWNTLFHHTDLAVGRIKPPDALQDELPTPEVKPFTIDQGEEVTSKRTAETASLQKEIITPQKSPTTPSEEPIIPQEEPASQQEVLVTPQEGSATPEAESVTPQEDSASPQEELEASAIPQETSDIPQKVLDTPQEASDTPQEEPITPQEACVTPQVASEKPTVVQEVVVTSEKEPVSSEIEPVSQQEEPIKEPVASEKEPIKEPVASEKEPIKEPVTSEKEPVSSDKELVSSDKEPVTSDKEPVSSDKEPVTSEREPVSQQEEPIRSQAEERGLSWSAEQWSSLFTDHNVLVLSAKMFLHCLHKGYLPLESLNLLVMDDCHLAEGDHPYMGIMSHVTKAAHAAPHLLCLTAAILGSEVSDPTQLASRIHHLEVTLNSKAETSMLVISERFGCRPKESVVQCKGDEDVTGMSEKLTNVLLDAWDFLGACQLPPHEVPHSRHDPLHVPKFAISECINILYTLGPWCAASIAENLISQLEKIVKHESNPTLKLFLRYTLTQLRLVTRIFEIGFQPEYQVEELLQYTTPKVQELIDILRKYKPEMDFMIVTREGDEDDSISDFSDDDGNDDDSFDLSSSDEEESKSKTKHIHIAVKKKEKEESENPFEEEKKLSGVVFVDNRYVAFALNKMVEEVCSWDENLCFVKSSHITGQGIHRPDGKKDLSKASRKQEEVLRRFRMQERNLLISTSVLEEGVDIPKCNLVVRFDPPQDYRSYTLSKGRARARDAEYVILVDEDLMEDFADEIQIFKGIEQVLIGAGRGRKDLEDLQQGDELSQLEFTPLPTFCPLNQPGAPSVSMKTAIGLVNRYCAKLPSDAFTHLTPHCRVCPSPSDPSQFVAYLRLPVNSPIKDELRGAEMPSRQLAKMAVALQMCELLHKAGELDNHLQPVGKEMFVCEEEEEEWDEEEEGIGQTRPGTTKRKQYYIKKMADALVSSAPKLGEECFLYSIAMTLTGPITEDQNTRGRKIYAPEDSLQSFGILLSSQIPHVPSFPVYTRSGEVTVWLELLKKGNYSDEQLEKLVGFHHFVFSSVLHLEKDPMIFCPESASMGMLIVPLNTHTEGQVDIEWSFVEQVNQKTIIQKGNVFDGDRQIFQFQQDQFEDAVVMPSYRNMDQPQHFYVAEIRHDLSPLSPFPSPELYKTFAAYYTTKYGLTLTNVDQPLLDVDHTSARLNLLTPRYMNQKGRALPTSSQETKRARRENLQQKQILVPELCDIHIFSASLWRKAVCLPAILYRTNYLLLAEELRKQIAGETGIGKVELDPDFRFPRLDFGFETNPEKLLLACQSEDNAEHQETGKSDVTGGKTSEGAHKETETSDAGGKKETEKTGVSTEKESKKLGDNTEKETDTSRVIAEKETENSGAETEGNLKADDQIVEQTGKNVTEKCHTSPAITSTSKRPKVSRDGEAGREDSSPDEDRTDTGASSDSDSGVVLSEYEGGQQSSSASTPADGVEGKECIVKRSSDDGQREEGRNTEHSADAWHDSGNPTHNMDFSLSHAGTCSPEHKIHSNTHTVAPAMSLSHSGPHSHRCSPDSDEEYPCADSDQFDIFVTPSSTRPPSPMLSDSDDSVYEDAVESGSESAPTSSCSSRESSSDSSTPAVFHHVCEDSLRQGFSTKEAAIPLVCNMCVKGSSHCLQASVCDRDIMCQTCGTSVSMCSHAQCSATMCSVRSHKLTTDGEGLDMTSPILPPSKPILGESSCHSHQVPDCTSPTSSFSSDTTKYSCRATNETGTYALSAACVCCGVKDGPQQNYMQQADQKSDKPHNVSGSADQPPHPIPQKNPSNHSVIVEDCEDISSSTKENVEESEDSEARNSKDMEECDDFLDVTDTNKNKNWRPSHSVIFPMDSDMSSFTMPKDHVHISFDPMQPGSESGLDSDWAHTTTTTSGVEWGQGENLSTFEVSGSLAAGMSDAENHTTASSASSSQSPLSSQTSHAHFDSAGPSQGGHLPQSSPQVNESTESSTVVPQISPVTSSHRDSPSHDPHSTKILGDTDLTSDPKGQRDHETDIGNASHSSPGFSSPSDIVNTSLLHTEHTCPVDKPTSTSGDIGELNGNPTTSGSHDFPASVILPDDEHSNQPQEAADTPSSQESVTWTDTEQTSTSSETADAAHTEPCGWGSEEARPPSEWCQLLDGPSNGHMGFQEDDSWDEEEEEENELGELRLVTSDSSSITKGVENGPVFSSTETQHTLQTDTHKDRTAELQHTAEEDTHKDDNSLDTQHMTQHNDRTRKAEPYPDETEESKTEGSSQNPSTHTEGSRNLDIPNGCGSPRQSEQPSIFDIGTWNDSKRSVAKDVKEIVVEEEDGGVELIKLDEDADLASFVGPSPCLLLQALTMSNANDFFSLERLETIGDSFLKYAITVYLYCTYPATHEGKLSYLRSKQVSNYNLYRLGRRKGLAERMVSTKFEPYENWLPPCYVISEDRRRGPVPKVVIATCNPKLSAAAPVNFLLEEEEESEEERKETEAFQQELAEIDQQQAQDQQRELSTSGHKQAMIPYSLQLHHGIPDKSVADCVEALIGCYLTTCGKKAALTFMAWLGLKVLPRRRHPKHDDLEGKVGVFPELPCPPSPLLCSVPEAPQLLEHLLEGYEEFETRIQYQFRDRSYLLQAFTHASYHYNYITDCYQRLEFLGDAILDYVITRHLYEDSHRYSPGILTDLRSALVNNNIFAALAVKWNFHKFFKAISPSLFIVIDKFVVRQKERLDEIDEIEEVKTPRKRETDEEEEGETEGKENLATEGAGEEVEDKEEVELEIPKALGDIFESVAGAIYLDSGMSLDAVWRVYYRMMKPHIDKYLKDIPKSPVRELLEMEPETAKFEKPERTLEGKIRVMVNVVGKGVFYGVGRNYRIAKSAAAKKALRFIRNLQMEGQA